jgi:hypothetical protein
MNSIFAAISWLFFQPSSALIFFGDICFFVAAMFYRRAHYDADSLQIGLRVGGLIFFLIRIIVWVLAIIYVAPVIRSHMDFDIPNRIVAYEDKLSLIRLSPSFIIWIIPILAVNYLISETIPWFRR